MGEVLNDSIGKFSSDDAAQNMEALSRNKYPGRVIGAGISADGDQVHIFTATMGRRSTSQTRRYMPHGDSVDSKPFGKDVDPLTEYRTMTRQGEWHIASNGAQTDDVFEAIGAEVAAGRRDHPFGAARDALLEHHHEPDTIHTPRISLVAGIGLLLPRAPVMFSIITPTAESTDEDPDSNHYFYNGHLADVALEAGVGVMISTYDRDGDPPPPFQGGPRPVLIDRTAEHTAELLEETLDEGGRFLVSAAVRAVDLRTGRVEETRIINHFSPHALPPDFRGYSQVAY